MLTLTKPKIRLLPTWDRLLILRSDASRTKSGLFLPGSFQGQVREGEILAVGPGRVESGIRVDSGFKVGQTVLFSNEAALHLDDEDERQCFVAAGAVLAVKVDEL